MMSRFARPEYVGRVGRLAPLALCLALGTAGCATSRSPGATPASAACVAPSAAHHVEMEPMRLEVVGQGNGLHIEALDAATLFEEAGAALQAEKWDQALAGYDRVVEKFPDSRYVVPSLYNAGLAAEGEKDYAAAVARYRVLVDKHKDAHDALDALFRMGRCLAELGDWAGSAEAFQQVLEHPLLLEDRLEATARRGLAQYNLKDLAAAERTFREVVALYHEHEAQERIDNVFFVALAQYHLAEIAHEAFRAIPLRLPEEQMKKDLASKIQALLLAQARYVDTARLKHPAWATAAGYQMASLYKEVYDALMAAPRPRMNDAMRQAYFDELKKTIEPLLRKAIHAHELTQQVAERNAVDNEWVRKSSEQLQQLKALVAPDGAVPEPSRPPDQPPNQPERDPGTPARDKASPPPVPTPAPRVPSRAYL